MEKKKAIDYNSSTLMYVESYGGSILKGRFYDLYEEKWVAFESTMEFLLKMEAALNEAFFPQPFTEIRCFGAEPDAQSMQLPEADNHSSRLATFNIKILFRQNASWQGWVSWLEGKQEESFRSVLELLFLINSAVQVH